jgi:hypothetical protein
MDDITQEEFTAIFDKVLKDHNASLVDRDKLHESVKQAITDAYARGYHAGFVDANKRWWKIWR